MQSEQTVFLERIHGARFFQDPLGDIACCWDVAFKPSASCRVSMVHPPQYLNLIVKLTNMLSYKLLRPAHI